ncbi:zinc-binding dehydrogenase [Trinickia sp. EG282A]|uniref:zinc-binding dehydrogenase n=1 Tax=Trinickia sp. EG282A TaxID=3237013 RepID=UPI0034D2F2FD
METLKVVSEWSDAELASIPCSYSTAENMLHRAKVGAEVVLITGASGGVGSAAVQLAKRRGATVIAQCSSSKASALRELGADRVVDRQADLVSILGENSVDAVIDVVGGEQWPSLLKVLRLGGRYAIAGAIAGPVSKIDLRTLYLKDLTLMGCTFQEDEVFSNLISYLERGEITPLVAKTFPLKDIRLAQEEFLSKGHLGKLVLIIPEVDA